MEQDDLISAAMCTDAEQSGCAHICLDFSSVPVLEGAQSGSFLISPQRSQIKAAKRFCCLGHDIPGMPQTLTAGLRFIRCNEGCR